MWIAKLPRLDVLRRLAVHGRDNADRVFKADARDVALEKPLEELQGFSPLLVAVGETMGKLWLHPLVARNGQVGARRVRNYHIPAFVDDVEHATLIVRPGYIGRQQVARKRVMAKF